MSKSILQLNEAELKVLFEKLGVAKERIPLAIEDANKYLSNCFNEYRATGLSIEEIGIDVFAQTLMEGGIDNYHNAIEDIARKYILTKEQRYNLKKNEETE